MARVDGELSEADEARVQAIWNRLASRRGSGATREGLAATGEGVKGGHAASRDEAR